MAVSKKNLRILLIAVVVMVLMTLCGCGGLFGLGWAVNRYSPRPEVTDAEWQTVLRAAEVDEVLGLGIGGEAVTETERLDIMGTLPRLEHTERLGALKTITELRSETTAERAERRLAVDDVMGVVFDVTDLGPVPWIEAPHSWFVMNIDDVDSTGLVVVEGTRYAVWRIEGAVVEDPDVLQQLLADEVAAFGAIGW